MENISIECLRRMPNYMRVLTSLEKEGLENVSSTTIANLLDLNPVQVRKDLACVSSVAGKPKTGFVVKDLIEDISTKLGFNNVTQAVLVGAGHLGRALLNYTSFSKFGLEIVAAFDIKVDPAMETVEGKPILELDKLSEFVAEEGIHMGVITVPKEHAQEVCDLMVASGIKAIWNFAPIRLNVPCDVALKSEDMAASLAVLSKQLSEILKKQNK